MILAIGFVVDAVAEAIEATDVVVVVEDEEGLRAVEVDLGFGDVLAEVSDVEGGVGAAGAVAFGVEADEHVHGELQLVLAWGRRTTFRVRWYWGDRFRR